ncbi:MAG: hypothetical protein KBD15_00895 [Candidatus Magasanikbacteria bacterium]|jgi:hypothetical protein|nr:hypothetical protein [Candidatus Magasanikbacteria bacterium]
MKFFLCILSAFVLGVGCDPLQGALPITPLHTPVPAKVVDAPTTSNDIDEAKMTLSSFFTYLESEEFEQAAYLFQGWESVSVYEDNAFTLGQVLQNYCEATGTCLQATIVHTKKVSRDEYVFRVEFQYADGSLFVAEPCCGATEDQSSSQTVFDFVVKRFGGKLYVVTPPVYRP